MSSLGLVLITTLKVKVGVSVDVIFDLIRGRLVFILGLRGCVVVFIMTWP